jgi:hypothetical protein
MLSIGSPFDPFQGGSTRKDPVQLLAERWEAALRANEVAADTDIGTDEAWDQKEAAEAAIFAQASPSLAGIALKLRVIAWQLDVDNGYCANLDGVRTTALEPEEVMAQSALADVERLTNSPS